VISNPVKRGALDQAILDEFAVTLPSLDARCLIITGRDSTFSAGYDIGDLPAPDPTPAAEQLVAHPFAAALEAIEGYPFPTVAALNGHTIGGGLELALSCDLRIASSQIKLAMPPARLGLVYSHTGIRKFIDAIGAPRTRWLFFTGRAIDAQTAQSWGLVNCVVELALACDLRIAAGTIALGMPPAKLGLVYSHTGIRKFIDTIGAPRTRELFLVGRRIDARTAREWGLVNAIAEEGRLA
jgi:enoyl-CoA hydratase/carnithine racemase